MTSTVLNFAVVFDSTKSSQPCGSLVVDTLRLNFNPDHASFIKSVTFAGTKAKFTVDPQGVLIVNLSGFKSVEASTLLVVTVSKGLISQSSFCSIPWWGNPATCPYTLVSDQDPTCCPTGTI